MVNVLALVIVCLSLAWVSVIVRFGIKIFMIGRIRWDDWILLLAVIIFSGQCSCTLVLVSAAPREHSVATGDIVPYMFMAAYNLMFMTSICVKTSFALSLNRCFAERWQRLLVTNMTLLFYIYASTRIFLDLFFCGLPSDMAHKELQQCKHYPGMVKWWFAGAIFNAVVTWVYILLPAVVIWLSRLTLKVKLAISIITVVGAISGLAATFRILGAGTFKALKDFNPINLDIIACMVAEMAFGIIATSMTNSTKLPSMLARTKSNNVRPRAAPVTYLEGGTTDFIKLSPILGPQKLAVDTWSATQTLKEFPALEQEALALPSPSSNTGRVSWDSSTFGSPKAAAPAPARLTLIIDDISDDEGEINMVKGSQGVKETFTNL
ncbi:hypothetical protein E4T49_02271 [Aureobasidium sp. EXF-10728]|nr:hypothetical protein E4T49_02271 [Aureobasidium sp. EXF-10728]